MNIITLCGLIAVAVLAVNGAEITDQCQSGKANLDVRMKNNKTGHWTTTIQLKQPTTVGSSSQPEIHLQAEPSVSVCGGIHTNSLLVTLEGPPPEATGYTHFPGVGSYKLHTERITWDEAKTACENEGAHLVIINSEKEAATIRELRNRHTNIDHWLFVGFSDPTKTRTFVTVFGEPLADTGYVKWLPGEPSNPTELCATIDPAAGFNDANCNSKLEFICEKNL